MNQITSLPAVVAFDYDSIEPKSVPCLRASAVSIRARVAKTTQDIIDTGQELAAAKQHLDHGQFAAWVEAEVGIDHRTAQRYMAAARLADGKNDIVSHLPPTTVHRLASKSAPIEVVNEVISRASAGEIISDRAVADMIAEVKHEKREAERIENQNARRRRMPRRKREEEEKRRQEFEAEKGRGKEASRKAAQILHDRLNRDELAVVMDAIDALYGDIQGELQKLAAAGAA
jgi:hypothetical protein